MLPGHGEWAPAVYERLTMEALMACITIGTMLMRYRMTAACLQGLAAAEGMSQSPPCGTLVRHLGLHREKFG